MSLFRAISVALVFVFVGIASQSHAGLEDERWLEVSSENFSLLSQLSRKKSIELIEQLEMFRVATRVVTNVRIRPESVPTQIYVFKNTAPWAYLDEERVGLFMPSLRRNTMLVRQTSQMDEVSVLLHEYVHYLIRSNNGIRYPSWFDEGLAEYLSSTRTKGDQFQVGLFLEDRLVNLQYSSWIPGDQLLSANRYGRWTKERRSMFYAQSWALVHFLLNSSEFEDSFAQRMSTYLEALQAGEEHSLAFEEAFGLAAEILNRRIQRYLERGRFPIVSFNKADLLPSTQPTVAKLSREAVALSLAELARSTGAFERARNWFEIAKEDDALEASALAGLGSVALYSDPADEDEAKALFENALALDSSEAVFYLDAANVHLRALEKLDDVANAASDTDRGLTISAAQKYLVEAWRRDNNSAEAYTKLGITIVAAGDDPARAVEMLGAARDLLPSNLYIRAQLALAHEQNGDVEDALTYAQSVLAWSHQDSPSARTALGVIERLAVADDSE